MAEKTYSYKAASERIKLLANETGKRHWCIQHPSLPNRYIISTIDPRPESKTIGSFAYADPGNIGGVAFHITEGIASAKPKLRKPDPPATSHARKYERTPLTPTQVLDAISDHTA